MKYKMLNVGAAAVLSAFLAVPAFANEANKIGYVNTQRVFRDAPAAVKAQKKLDAEFSRRDQDLQVVAKKLQTLQENLEKNGVTMSESERRNKERELNDLNRDFQRRQREFREDLNLRQNEEMAAVLEKANKAIKQIAENEKFDLILQDVVWVSPKLDITDKVIKALSDDKAGK
ncbi:MULTISPECIES: OmpH family outer membrane protein [Azospira]|uniref:Periplasmic chaperone for outer membrane proteins Skp n=1 Tax=Azospira oryzae TaxID=146939 RepID=A0ABY0IS63_9RHOO|nr:MULTISPECIES: OmpH family outer membrane protein [Azospira]MDK9691495.1 OmpH family outer membrane protein [Azospira sp.]RZT89932.1 periplasmic chaperone for outer membrane proteins Skp [Azospira oryzae]